MPTYLVTWEIDINARSPREAAQKALEMQRDRTGPELQFTVLEPKGSGHVTHQVDLSYDEKEEKQT